MEQLKKRHLPLSVLLASLFFNGLFAVDEYPISNVLIYGDTVEIDTQINTYQNLTPGSPIQGSVMVTHAANNLIDEKSFSLNNTPLKVQFVKTVAMSYGNIVLSIYNFQIEGFDKGMHILPPIKVKVGGKEYLSPPNTIYVD